MKGGEVRLAMRLWIVTLATRPSGRYVDVAVDELV